MEGHIFMNIQTAQDETCGKKEKEATKLAWQGSGDISGRKRGGGEVTKTQHMKF